MQKEDRMEESAELSENRAFGQNIGFSFSFVSSLVSKAL